MTLDSSTKVVTIVSVIVGLMLSVAGYFANIKFTSLEANLNQIDLRAKEVDVVRKEYDSFARLGTDFLLPLARTFALRYRDPATVSSRSVPRILFPLPPLRQELLSVLDAWETRHGLMTGSACDIEEGLKARQVVTLMVENLGYADALNVSIKGIWKSPPKNDLDHPWQEIVGGKPIAYSDLSPGMSGWQSIDFPMGTLRGQSSQRDDTNAVTDKVQIVLASVSGLTDLYGTVLVPLEVSWTDAMSKKSDSMKIADLVTLSADLQGAEIGTVGRSTCGRR
jgi:hypothetical protein